MNWIKKWVPALLRIILALSGPMVIAIFIGILTYRIVFNISQFERSISSFNFPIILLISVLLFRNAINDKLKQMNELKYREMIAKFELPSVINQEQTASREFAEIARKGPDSIFNEAEIENVMKMAASWGYNMANMGFKSTPIPEIEWRNNVPSIKFAKSANVAIHDESEKQFIISQIMETLEALDGLTVFEKDLTLSGLVPSRQSVLKKKLNRLYEQLRAIDPTSIFLPRQTS